MATMIHGQWADGLNRRRQVTHLHTNRSAAGFGPTACGIRVEVTSSGRTTHLPQEVTCRNCRRYLDKLQELTGYAKATKGASS